MLCDWLPWNHTAGGNHNFGLVLYNGGTLYIDEGRPLPGAFEATLRNLREVAATAHFTVPRTLRDAAAAPARRRGAARAVLLAAARSSSTPRPGSASACSTSSRRWRPRACGEQLLWVTGFGATETAPFALCTGSAGASAGFLGFPVAGPGAEAGAGGREARGARDAGRTSRRATVAIPSARPPPSTRRASIALGDAMRFVDPADPAQGLVFDGRLAEDFKLSTGTWVERRRRCGRGSWRAAQGLLQDVVIAGHDRAFVSALLFPNLAALPRRCAPSSRPGRVGAGGARRPARGRERIRGPARASWPARAPAARPSWRARSSSTRRRRSTPARSPTRARSTRRPCSRTARALRRASSTRRRRRRA